MGNAPSSNEENNETTATFQDAKNRYLDAASSSAAAVDKTDVTSINGSSKSLRPAAPSKLQSWPPPPQHISSSSSTTKESNNSDSTKRTSTSTISKDSSNDDDGNQQVSLLREAVQKRNSSIWNIPSMLFGGDSISEIILEEVDNDDHNILEQNNTTTQSYSDQLDVSYWKKMEKQHRRSIRKQQKQKLKLLEEVKEQLHKEEEEETKDEVEEEEEEKEEEEKKISVVTPEKQQQKLPSRLPFLSSLSSSSLLSASSSSPSTAVVSPATSTPKKKKKKSTSSSSSTNTSSGISPRRASSKNNKDWIQKKQAAYLTALATPGRPEKKKVGSSLTNTPTKTPTRRIKTLNLATPKRAKKKDIFGTPKTPPPPPKRRGRKPASFNIDDDDNDGDNGDNGGRGGSTAVLFVDNYIKTVLSRITKNQDLYHKEIRQSIETIHKCNGFPKSRRLSMRDNDLICTVVGAIQNDPLVTDLDVDCVDASYFGTISTTLLTQFVDSLKLNIHLTHLTLRGVELGNDILKALSNGPLEMNFSLKCIDLSLNCFTSEGLSEFLISIGNFNQTLIGLSLEDQTTPISIASQIDVLEALQKNYSLREVNVDFQSEEEGKDLLLQILERNRQHRLDNINDINTNLDTKIVEVYRDMADVARSLDEQRKSDESMIVVDIDQVVDWNYYYELAVLFDKHKLKKEIQAESDDPTGSKKLMADNAELTGKAKSEFLFGKFKDIMEDSVACFNSDGSFLNDEFISKFLVDDPDTTAVVFDFHGQWKLFKRFPPQDPHRNLIVTKFVDAIVSHSRASEFTGISMANTGCGDDFLATLSERLIEDPTLLPNLQMINFETNYINETGVVALSKLISHQTAAKYLQVVRLENQKGLLKSKAEVILMKAMSVNRSVVVLGLRLRNLLEKQQIGKYLVRNIDLIRQARQRHAKDTGTQRKRNEVEQVFDRVAENDPTIDKIDMSTQKRFLTLTGEEKCKAASSLAVNKFVKSVNFTSCGIDDEFSIELGKAIRTNQTIEKLFLENNAISGDGVKAIFEGLADNGSIEEIRLHHQSKLTNSGDEEFLADIIEKNTTIITIGIDLRSTVARVKLDRKLKLNRNKQLKLRRTESNQQHETEQMEAEGKESQIETEEDRSEGLTATKAAEVAQQIAFAESKDGSDLEVAEDPARQEATDETGGDSFSVGSNGKAAKIAEEDPKPLPVQTEVEDGEESLEENTEADKLDSEVSILPSEGGDADEGAKEEPRPERVDESASSKLTDEGEEFDGGANEKVVQENQDASQDLSDGYKDAGPKADSNQEIVEHAVEGESGKSNAEEEIGDSEDEAQVIGNNPEVVDGEPGADDLRIDEDNSQNSSAEMDTSVGGVEINGPNADDYEPSDKPASPENGTEQIDGNMVDDKKADAQGYHDETEQSEEQGPADAAKGDKEADAQGDDGEIEQSEKHRPASAPDDDKEADAQVDGDESTEQSEEQRSAHADVAEALPESTKAERERFLTAKKWDIPTAIVSLRYYVDWNIEHETIANEHSIERQTTDNPDTDIWIQACSIAMKANSEIGDHTLPQIIRTYKCDSGTVKDIDGHRIFHTMPAQMDNTLAQGATYALATALFINLHLDRDEYERITVCMDFRAGKGWPNVHAMNQVPFMTETTKLLLSLFPQRLHKCLVYPVPSTFYWIWTVISKIIDPVTAEKICVLSGANRIVSPPPLDEMIPHLGKEVAELLEEARVAGFKE